MHLSSVILATEVPLKSAVTDEFFRDGELGLYFISAFAVCGSLDTEAFFSSLLMCLKLWIWWHIFLCVFAQGSIGWSTQSMLLGAGEMWWELENILLSVDTAHTQLLGNTRGPWSLLRIGCLSASPGKELWSWSLEVGSASSLCTWLAVPPSTCAHEPVPLLSGS